jgi:ABC-2 type transport system ATP-binding protein/lipopolysaccharide transport system ATP-binding protein
VSVGNGQDRSNLAIVADDVSKRFRLYKDKPSSLKEMVTSLKGVHYEEFWALRNVSMSIPTGTTYGLVGPNGSGKSTLLRLFARIHRPTEGRITTHGRVSALLDLGAGFHPELSGRENVFLNGSILGLGRREIARAFDDIVEFAGLADFIDSPVKVYSTGMYVRLGFSVAIHVKPEVLIIDEVIAVGDAEFQRRCFEHLYTLKRQGVTIVLVSHGLGLMQDMCDGLAWLDHGRLAAEGRPMEVIREYIRHVDDQEAERLLGPAYSDANPKAHRIGTQEVEIESFQILNAAGEPIPMAITGEPTILRVTYTAKKPIENATFGISIDHESGTPLTALHTGDTMETGTIYGRGHIDYHIPRFTFMPGKMVVSLGIADRTNTHAYDYRHQWVEFHVRAGDHVMPRGMVELVGHWDPPTSEVSRELTG